MALGVDLWTLGSGRPGSKSRLQASRAGRSYPLLWALLSWFGKRGTISDHSLGLLWNLSMMMMVKHRVKAQKGWATPVGMPVAKGVMCLNARAPAQTSPGGRASCLCPPLCWKHHAPHHYPGLDTLDLSVSSCAPLPFPEGFLHQPLPLSAQPLPQAGLPRSLHSSGKSSLPRRSPCLLPPPSPTLRRQRLLFWIWTLRPQGACLGETTWCEGGAQRSPASSLVINNRLYS